jgi:hypothetical protein
LLLVNSSEKGATYNAIFLDEKLFLSQISNLLGWKRFDVTQIVLKLAIEKIPERALFIEKANALKNKPHSFGVYSADFNVTIVSGAPVAPNTPTGSVNLCINSANEDYTTVAVAEASSYEWLINPSNAGLITGTGLTGTVDWGSSYFGTADISVRAINSCGNGPYSTPLTVTITPVPFNTIRLRKMKLWWRPLPEITILMVVLVEIMILPKI